VTHRWWRPRSIRTRLLAMITALLVLGLAGSAAGTGWAVRSYLDHRIESQLTTTSHRISTALANRPNGTAVGRQIAESDLQLLIGPNAGLVVVSPDGRVALSAGLATVDPQFLVRATAERTDGQVISFGGSVPVAVLRIPTPGLTVQLRSPDQRIPVASVVIAADLTANRATIRRLVAAQLAAGFVAILLLAGLTALVIRAGLRPLTELEDAVEAVGSGRRDAEDPLPAGSSETAQLAVPIQNAFAARARAEQRLRSFVADASHELRTPLSTISGWVDLHLQGAIPAGAPTQHAMERMEAELGRMRLLVDELALLARLDAQVPHEQARVDLAQIAAEVVEDARIVTADRQFDLRAPTPTTITGDEEQLRRVLRNLVGNAVQHTPAGTPVTVEVDTVGPQAVVRVVDTGDGIDPAQVPHLFERFWRADESRTRARGGSGLGLSIVQAVITAHAGTVVVSSAVGVGTTVTITLPIG
jgi:two-component system OmpR family sensor kinase